MTFGERGASLKTMGMGSLKYTSIQPVESWSTFVFVSPKIVNRVSRGHLW